MEKFYSSQLLQQDEDTNFHLVINGQPSTTSYMKLGRNVKYFDFQTFCQEIKIFLDIKQAKIRIFKQDGVEILKEDYQFLKNGDILYISKGEEFDESSNFAIYKRLQLLGQGGFGKVYLAENLLSRERVALKILDKKKFKNVEELEYLFQEVQSLKNLNHRNIIQVHNCYHLKEQDQFALILEYLEGGDLRDYIQKKGPLPEQFCQNIFHQIWSGVQYCHKNKIIHRDLKVDNIIFTSKLQNEIKIIDFGISGSNLLLNQDFTNVGTLKYLAPEVLQKNQIANPKIDVWAMGIILYIMITAKFPFDGKDFEETKNKIVKGIYKIEKDTRKIYTRAVLDLIANMLKVNHKDRYHMKDVQEHRWMSTSVAELQQLEQIEDEEVENQKTQKIEEVKQQQVEFEQTIQRDRQGNYARQTISNQRKTTLFQAEKSKKDTTRNILPPLQHHPNLKRLSSLMGSQHVRKNNLQSTQGSIKNSSAYIKEKYSSCDSRTLQMQDQPQIKVTLQNNEYY